MAQALQANDLNAILSLSSMTDEEFRVRSLVRRIVPTEPSDNMREGTQSSGGVTTADAKHARNS